MTARTDTDGQLLPLSAAVAILMRGMFGGFPQAKPVHKIKRDYRKALSFSGHGRNTRNSVFEWRRLWESCPSTRRVVYDPAPLLVPPDVIARLVIIRGGLPGHPNRPTLKIVGGNGHLLRVLQTGTLLVREKEFVSWYKAKRRRNRWPSQRSSKKGRGAGRLTKMTAALQRGSRSTSRIQKRQRCPAPSDSTRIRPLEVPSVDTLERLLDQLYRETGDPRFFRAKRRRRKRD